MLITHMQDLQEVTQETHYENFRADNLAGNVTAKSKSGKSSSGNNRIENGGGDISDKERELRQKEEELRRMQEQLVRMQAEFDSKKPQHVHHNNGDLKSQDV
uniref:Septin-type G domain-containing protein n=1 Tax=Arion vulgaris TaxID=1028688 RepID=A0A0B7AFL7_9EUPU